MSTIAIEAALADLTAWRRDAERRIARLETDLAHPEAARTAAHPVVPQFLPPPPWAPAGPVALAPVAPAWAPAAPVAPLIGAPPAAPSAPAALAPTPAPSRPAIDPAQSRSAPTQPPGAISTRAPRHTYDLEMRPGESIDLPSGLDGGRRKKVMGWLVVLVILAGMAGLVISALLSQR